MENTTTMNNDELMPLDGFSAIPNLLMFKGDEITDQEFRLFCVLFCRAINKDLVWPSRETIAAQMGCSVSKVDRVKRNLEEKGYIKKRRRGQGISNIYKVNKDLVFEVDDAEMTVLDSSLMTREEDKKKKIKNNNYLENQKSKTSKNEKASGNTTASDFSPTLSKSSSKSSIKTEIVVRRMLKKMEKEISQISSTELENTRVSSNTHDAKEAIIYYIQRYKGICLIDHPRYHKDQLFDCFMWFLDEIWLLEQENLPTLPILKGAIDRWFITSSKDPNSLRLSHFVGQGSLILHNSAIGFYNENVDNLRLKEDN